MGPNIPPPPPNSFTHKNLEDLIFGSLPNAHVIHCGCPEIALGRPLLCGGGVGHYMQTSGGLCLVSFLCNIFGGGGHICASERSATDAQGPPTHQGPRAMNPNVLPSHASGRASYRNDSLLDALTSYAHMIWGSDSKSGTRQLWLGYPHTTRMSQ